MASGDRTAALARVTAPTLVVHGTDDPLIGPAGGHATAAAIPDATLALIDGMAHDLPPQVFPRLLELLQEHRCKAT
jgi:pimeloyl-ACP methyl ester carboxylesterase